MPASTDNEDRGEWMRARGTTANGAATAPADDALRIVMRGADKEGP